MTTIALTANVALTMNAIDDGLRPVVDPNNGTIYVLNTGARHLGNLLWTEFERESLFPLASYTVFYGSQHTIVQVLFAPFTSRLKLDYFVDTEVPGQVRPEFDPMIIPNGTITYPTEVDEKPKTLL